jgi:radical SAM protein with 4Fe4S-binding SPASM domain
LLEIQPTAHCHRVCSFCSHILRNQAGGELSAETVSAILRDARTLGVDTISISGGGEPLIWAAGDLAAAMSEARRFARVSLTTSGDQLWNDADTNLAELGERIIANCDDLLLNIPATDDDTFARTVTGGRPWSETEHLLKTLVARRRAGGECRVLCVVVVNTDNIGKLTAIDRTFCELGVDDVYYKPFKLYEERSPARRVDPRQLYREIREHVADARQSPGLRRFVNSLAEATIENHPCWANRLALSAIVDPSGDLYLCTPTVGQPGHAIGNVVRASLIDLWKSAHRRKVMESLSERSASGGCPTDCRYRRHNAAIAAAIATPGRSQVAGGGIANAGLESEFVIYSAAENAHGSAQAVLQIRKAPR